MHHHPHMDEFSVTDIRHTLGEVWRVVRDRRWYFLLPFLGVSTAALVCSLWIPRQWTVNTVIRREHDPVLTSMAGKSWTEPYTEIRQRMTGELTDLDTITNVLAQVELPQGAEKFSATELTPAGANARRALATQVAAGLTIKNLESSPNRDVVSIRLVLDDRANGPVILRTLRDHYIAEALKRTTQILHGVESFFLAESNRCRQELTDLQKQILELELKHPGLNPESVDQGKARQSALMVENIQLERQLDDLREQRVRLEQQHAGAMQSPESSSSAGAVIGTLNPRRAELLEEMEKIQREIVEGRSVKRMTDQHPTMIRLRAAMESKQEEYEKTPPTEELAQAAAEPGITPAQRVQSKIDELDSQIANVDRKFSENKQKLGKYEQERAAMVEHREGYFKLKEKSARLQEELGNWQQSLAPIKQALALESGNRGIHFTTVRDVEPALRPTSPDARIVVGLCFAIGAAVAAIIVLLVELMDRSFRTAHAVSSVLGIPVIESIDEIRTALTGKKRALARVFALPGAALVLTLGMIAASAFAYSSIAGPHDGEGSRNFISGAISMTSDDKAD